MIKVLLNCSPHYKILSSVRSHSVTLSDSLGQTLGGRQRNMVLTLQRKQRGEGIKESDSGRKT